MIRTQIYLTDAERQKLNVIAEETGASQSALIREAIDLFIKNRIKQQLDQHSALQAAKGLWADRHDLPDLATLRKEIDDRTSK